MSSTKLKYFFILTISFFAVNQLFAQDTTSVDSIEISHISGTAPEYANMTVKCYKFTDYFTRTEELVGFFKIDSSGNFNFSFENSRTQEFFMYLGIYKCYVFVEPDSSYRIILPPRADKTLADELNPYFQYEELSLGIQDPAPNELNMLIFEFNTMYESFIAENFQWIYVFRDKRIVDVLEHKVDSIYKDVDNEYFNAYKNYRIYTLRYMAYQRHRIGVTRNYFLNQPAHYYNPPYINLFQMIWKDYIINNYMKDIGIDMRQSIIYGKSPTMFKERLEKHMALRNDTLKELILLQCLHDCFKEPEIFPQRTVYQTLDSLILITKIPEHRTIAKAIRSKQTKLYVNDKAPGFSLYTKDSILVSLDQFKGKHVYLNFCRSENYACIQDYKIMALMNRKTRNHLQIVTVSYESDFATFKDFADEHQNGKEYNWTFLYGGNNPELMDAYRVKGTPSYVLIDPEGKIQILSAPTPMDDFQQKFAEIIIQRKQEEKERRKQERLQREW